MSFTCYLHKNFNNVPHGIVLRLRKVCDTDKKFEAWAREYKQYLRAQDYYIKLLHRQQDFTVTGKVYYIIYDIAILLVYLYIYLFNLLRKYIVFMKAVILKIFYGAEENIVSSFYQ